MPNGESAVIDFLTRNPDFLVRHPDLLRRLSVPHGLHGKTVSLLEYQARLLRERLAGFEQQYETENRKAIARRSLSKSLKLLVPGFYACNEPTGMLAMLEAFLREHYSATSIRIFTAAQTRKEPRCSGETLRPLDVWRRGLFTLILDNPRPLCDSLQQDHLIALFGNEAENIRASLLLPFRYCGKEALLALGSTGWNSYRQGVELDILTVVVEILSHASDAQAERSIREKA